MSRSGGLPPHAVVLLAGIGAAMHVGKLPPALPLLQQQLALSLPQAGLLLSGVQLAGMSLGLVVGLSADGLGLRRTLLCGLLLLGLASVLGAEADSAAALLWLRALEGLGFLAVSLPAPALMRQLVPPQRISGVMGLWGSYMPFATALALLIGPWCLALSGWPAWWTALGLLSWVMAAWVAWAVPADSQRQASTAPPPWRPRLKLTLSARGPWRLALSFAVYSGQWLAVIGFLPTIYAQSGQPVVMVAWLSAGVAAANILGNWMSGWALQHGASPRRLLQLGFSAMALGAVLTFTAWTQDWPGIRYLSVLVFSALGGLIPGTLFALSVREAPSEHTVATTVGWMQQWSALGQFAGPPLVAWLAERMMGWHWTWAVTGLCCLAGLVLAKGSPGADPNPSRAAAKLQK